MNDENVNNNPEQPTSMSEAGISRRGLLQTLASIPVLGVFFLNFLKKKAADDARKQAILEELGVMERGPAVIPEAVSRPPGNRIRPRRTQHENNHKPL